MPAETPRDNLALETRDVSKFFGDHAALKSVSVEVGPGDSILLYGPNGAGKTTLLRIMASLARPTSGKVFFAGQDIELDGMRAKAATGFVSHATFLYSELTVGENLKFFGSLFRLAALEQKTAAALELFELRDRENVRVRDLSRGLQQRVSLARALLHDPKIILLDEPFTGLDRHSAEKLGELLRRLPEQGKGLLFSNHDFAQGAGIARRLVVLGAGRLRYNGPLSAAPLEALGIQMGDAG
jgi:heme ABC exporter ATP-binding subunit CcmA